MLKLYRKSDFGYEHWEAWDVGGSVTIHWGRLGDDGETRSVPTGWFRSASKVINSESQLPKGNGFSEISIHEHHQVVVQYRLTSTWGTDEELKTRHEIENTFNERLGWTGNGHCDGGDIGSGTMNIFCFVVEPDTAAMSIRDALRSGNRLEGAVIAIQEGEDYKIVWPQDFSGVFSII